MKKPKAKSPAPQSALEEAKASAALAAPCEQSRAERYVEFMEYLFAEAVRNSKKLRDKPITLERFLEVKADEIVLSTFADILLREVVAFCHPKEKEFSIVPRLAEELEWARQKYLDAKKSARPIRRTKKPSEGVS
jgi:hypothetical protein